MKKGRLKRKTLCIREGQQERHCERGEAKKEETEKEGGPTKEDTVKEGRPTRKRL